MSGYKTEYKIGDKLVVEIPDWLRDKQISPDFQPKLIEWVNTFEKKGKLEFLCIDYYGMCWFREK